MAANSRNDLTIIDENGDLFSIQVLDIIDRKISLLRKKSYIIYTIEDEPDHVYASILNEKAHSYSLDTITDPDDIDFVTREIERIINSEE